MSADALSLHAADDVAVALRALGSGETLRVGDRQITLRADIPMAHKFAVRDIAAGQPVRKYGEIIGAASEAIAVGDHVHVHNLTSRRGRTRP